jgi:tetratricopeptide (TPR) repeat protein
MRMNLPKRLNEYLGDRWILVVEPTANYRTSLKQFLANLKAKKVKLVGSVADARREMLTTKVGLFIVEWALDEQNGIQFCRALRQEPAYKQTPYMLLSVENLKMDVILAAEVDISGYLLKPFSYEDFCAQLDAMIRKKTEPTQFAVTLDTADAMVERGELEAAEKLFVDAIQQKSRSARAYCGLARVSRARGQAEQAMEHVKQALALNAEYIEAYRLMLELCVERKDRAGIVQAASVLHQMSPNNPRYALLLAKTYLELNELEGSENFFRKTLALSPRMAEAYKGLGSVYLIQEEYERAVKNFKKALDLDKGDVSTLNALGLAYVRMGQFKEGITRYLIALKLDPQDSRVLFNVGQAYEKRGDFERARWYYAQALVHKSGFVKAQRGLERVEKRTAGAAALRHELLEDASIDFMESDDGDEDQASDLKKSS